MGHGCDYRRDDQEQTMCVYFRIALVCCGIALAGCSSTVTRPNWLNPGPLNYQRSEAVQYDPYPDNTMGPTMAGVRPRDYEDPREPRPPQRALAPLAMPPAAPPVAAYPPPYYAAPGAIAAPVPNSVPPGAPYAPPASPYAAPPSLAPSGPVGGIAPVAPEAPPAAPSAVAPVPTGPAPAPYVVPPQ